MTITVMMPAYDEEQDLPRLLERIGEALGARTDWRVLVVDDGSTDATAQIVLDAGARMPVTLIRHPRNLGLGAAIRTGLRAACDRDGVVVTLDADNSQDPMLIPRMIATIEAGCDVVVASRFLPGAAEIGVPLHRRFLSHASSRAIRALVRYPGVRDYTCGFRAYRVATLRRLVNAYGDDFVRENGFACMLELLLNLRRLGARVVEVPLVLRYDLKAGPSKMRVLRTMARYAVTLARGFLPLRRSGGAGDSAPEPAAAVRTRAERRGPRAAGRGSRVVSRAPSAE